MLVMSEIFNDTRDKSDKTSSNEIKYDGEYSLHVMTLYKKITSIQKILVLFFYFVQ